MGRRKIYLIGLLIWAMSWLLIQALPAQAGTSANITAATTTPEWLEPRGLSILDLVGFVPESYLQGAIIYDRPGYGILRYQSGKRVGNTVVLTATAYTRYDRSWDGALFGCLGEPARMDQWPTVVPETRLRIYTANGTDITHKTVPHFYVPAGLIQPVRGPDDYSEPNYPFRYSRAGEGKPLSRDAQGNLIVPANMGCELMIPDGNQGGVHEYKTLTLVFTAVVTSHVNIQVMGSEDFTFKSYIGPGFYGKFEPLANQMRSNFLGRHDKFIMNKPPEANYVLLNFPPTPVDMYSNLGDSSNTDNVAYPSGGTYRLTFWENDQEYLSVDFVASMAFPLLGAWIDSDQAGNVTYLPYKRESVAAAAPEYMVPSGIPYDPCMLKGTCSTTLLNQIYDTNMTMKIIYLKVTRTDCNLQRIPLRMVGKAWVPGMTAMRTAPLMAATRASGSASPLIQASIYSTSALTRQTYLPLVLNRLCVSPPPDDPEGCPCGWFDELGRMLAFIP